MDFSVSNLAITILAAGESKRMGSPKAFLQIEGKTLLERILSIAKETNVQNIFLVTGAYHQEMIETVKKLGVEVLFNSAWQEGMASSLRTSIEAVNKNPTIKGMLVLLIDQPYVNKQLLENLISTFQKNPNKPVASYYKNVNGVPAIFPRAMWQELLDLSGDKGARQLLNKREDVISIPFLKGAIDLDYPSDFDQLKRADL